MNLRKTLAAATLAAASCAASAAVVFDRSPDATPSAILVGNFLNVAEDQNLPQWFSERFKLSKSTTLTGMDLYGNSYTTSPIGRTVLLRVWAGTEDGPLSLQFREQSTISAFDAEGTNTQPSLTRRFAAFSSPFLAEADTTYWVSMAGLTIADNIALASYVFADDGGMWLGRGGDEARAFVPFAGDMAFRLHGNEVPEPQTLALAAGALLVLAFWQRRRRATAAVVR